MRNHRKDRGFTLIEALVALVVLSIGMLGIAALCIEALRASRAALVRTEAVTLATDMADRIRANRSAGAAYAGAAADAANVDCEAGGVGCSPAELAAHDLFIWGEAIGAALPEGTGAVTHVDVDPDDGTPAVYEVTVTWTEPGQGELEYVARVEA
jgi:type IV pilus assembly protein PilV